MEEASRRLFDFNAPEELGCWEIVNDDVMGDASESRMTVSVESIATFQGTVLLDRGGGFASVCTYPQPFGLSGYSGLRILARGDGKRYRVLLRTDDEKEGIVYDSPFETKARTWVTIDIPFSRFVPTVRGRTVAEAPRLMANSIRRIGVMIADKQDGPFRLDIDWIDAYGVQE